MKNFAEIWPRVIELHDRLSAQNIKCTSRVITEQLGVGIHDANSLRMILGNLATIQGRSVQQKTVKHHSYGRRHLFIPDSQITKKTPWDFLRWIGEYIADKQPDVIVHGGDFADMESLSFYDKGKIQFEGRRYKEDIEAANMAFAMLCKPWKNIPGYEPECHITLGNHEQRIIRAVEDNAVLEGTIGIEDLEYAKHGFNVVPFLEILTIDGLAYCHYFYNRQSGRPIGGENISLRIKNLGFSFVMGHQQMYLCGTKELNNGRMLRGLVQGACYLHAEKYRGKQANNERRDLFMLHEVQNGDYRLMEISLGYLCQRYEGVTIQEFMTKKYPNVDSPFNTKRR
jgi:hypothetical protein